MKKSFPRRIIKSLASVKLSLTLISLAGIAMIAATLYERSVNPAVATSAVHNRFYGSYWFAALIVLLALNVFMTVINRYPWKWFQAGFIVTHLSIVVIIVGAAVTRMAGLEGVVILREGQSTSEVALRRPTLRVSSSNGQIQVPVDYLAGPKKGNFSLLSGPGQVDLSVTGYFANAEHVKEIAGGGEHRRLAVKVSVAGMQANMSADCCSGWLVSGDPENDHFEHDNRAVQLVAAENMEAVNRALAVPSKVADANSAKLPELGLLHVQVGQKGEYTFPVMENLGKTVPLGDTGFQLKISKYLSTAVVGQGGLVDAGGPEPKNPALIAEILGPSSSETHYVFSRFPDFNSLHGKKDSASGAKLRFEFAPMGAKKAEQVILVAGPDNRLYYRTFSPEGLPLAGQVPANGEIDAPWGKAGLRIGEIIPDAQWVFSFREVAPRQTPDENNPAIQLAYISGSDRRTIWLGYGDKKKEETPTGKLEFDFGPWLHPLGFNVRLDDFRIKTYGGSSMPASYESDMTIEDHESGLTFRRTIQMNSPLRHKGYTFYQSSYEGADTSILSVSSDPGTPIIYTGFAAMIIGIFAGIVLPRIRHSRLRRRAQKAVASAAASNSESEKMLSREGSG